MHPETPIEIDSARSRGRLMRAQLVRIGRAVGFDPRLISQYGAVATEVEYGPEIEMLRPFRPASLVISEPVYTATPAEKMNEGLKLASWAVLGRNLPLTVFREYPSATLNKLEITGRKFGLVTRLNIWPEFSRLTDPIQVVSRFLTQADRILVPGGLVAVSFVEKYDRVLERAADSIRQSGVELETRIFHSDNSFGRWTLVGKRVSFMDHQDKISEDRP